MPNYGDALYWEERYKTQQNITFDWLENYHSLQKIISSFEFEKESIKTLMLGCGNAEISFDMYVDGFRNIENIDISQVVITQMSEKYSNYDMNWKVMDVRDLLYDDNTFDFIVDKSTMDALLCGESSFINVAIMLNEVQRVLKVNGIYMIISYGKPENRMFHLEREHLGFDIIIYSIKKDNDDNENEHFIYICQKKEKADEKSKENYRQVISKLIELERLEEIEISHD
jgi:ubiquinone/menaquinone biosynthesis C-methylase UbiE